MNPPTFPESLLTRAAFVLLLALPAAAATPTLTLTIDAKAAKASEVEVGFPEGAPKDNAVIKIYEGATKTGDVDITMRLTQGGTSSARLTRPGTYTLSFSGFAVSCSPKLYLALPDLPGASHTALFTAKGDLTSSRITVKDLVCDSNAKRYFQFQADGIKVTAPGK